MEHFHPTVRQWFDNTFGEPTPIQRAGWPAVATDGHVLLSAPTGSGKTLAAFLWSIDKLLRDDLPKLPRVLYVSPLKALGNDIERNLREPLRSMQSDIRVAIRSGDSLPADRRRLVTRPPHILITTPESLYLLLGARRSRPILAELETVIVDEIHALAPSKRGAHLLLSLARLDHLCGRPLQRIGLSATQKPLQRVADFLCHNAPCTLVETPLERPRQLSIFCPSQNLSAVASSELWAEVCDRLAEVVGQHRTTLVFTHTRRLAERLTRQLADRLGETRVAAHHGALARERRLSAERRLKSGELSALVATASMELGIDVGHIDIVCHVGAPRSIGNLVQRVGRSGRSLGRDSKGLLFPLTRDDLVQCAAAVRAAGQGELDALSVPPGTPDVLAQQLVAMAATPDGIDTDEAMAMARRCHVYRTLNQETLHDILAMLTDGPRPLLYWDRLHHRIHGRPGSLSIALGSAGTIADTGDYDVIELPGETPVGRLNEDFAIESSVGDVFLLGSTAWRIRRQSRGRVYVEAAPGQNANVPFWLGEAPGRSPELSNAVSELRLQASSGPLNDDLGLDERGMEQLYRYVRESKEILGHLPGPDRVVIERFFDDSGGMQLVLHAPFGSRINRAWGLALRKRFCVTFDFELQAAATDDGILISLSRRHSFDLASVFNYVQAPSLKDDLTAAVLQGPVFGRRWREIATRALLLPRARHGRKVPVALQRMKAEDLLASVFPDQVMCQDNRTGPIIPPPHPLVDETLRECLEEWMDEPGLRALLGDIKAGRLTCHAIDTVAPSPLSHAILNAMPYAFLDDAPLEERRARAVSTWGPSPAPRLDPTVVQQVALEAWPRIEDAHSLHHLLTRIGWLTADQLAPWQPFLETLLGDGRVVPHPIGVYAAAETLAWVSDPDEIVAAKVVGAWMDCLGPVADAALARHTGLTVDRIQPALLRLEASGLILRTGNEWCHRDRLARIHRETLRRLRDSVEPVAPGHWAEFVQTWQQRVTVEAAVAQLQGLELDPEAWEEVLGGRTTELEMLCLTGVLGWARLRAAAAPSVDEPRSPFCLPSSTPRRRLGQVGCFQREAHGWLAGPRSNTTGRARLALERLQARGATFSHELGVEDEALEELAALGRASTDSLAPWRGAMRGRWFSWPEPAVERVEPWARQLLRRYGIVFPALLQHEPLAPSWSALRRLYAEWELQGHIVAGRFVSTFSGEQYALREAVAALRHGGAGAQPLPAADPIRRLALALAPELAQIS